MKYAYLSIAMCLVLKLKLFCCCCFLYILFQCYSWQYNEGKQCSDCSKSADRTDSCSYQKHAISLVEILPRVRTHIRLKIFLFRKYWVVKILERQLNQQQRQAFGPKITGVSKGWQGHISNGIKHKQINLAAACRSPESGYERGYSAGY